MRREPSAARAAPACGLVEEVRRERGEDRLVNGRGGCARFLRGRVAHIAFEEKSLSS
jgi:hypothetical protein